jgi:SAM-dependent methyltransferase
MAGVEMAFVQGDMINLGLFVDERFDLVLSVCAIMYVADLGCLFQEVTRVLKPGGRLIFSVDHPLLQTIGATDLWPEEGADPRYDYRGPVVWKWSPEDEFSFTTYRRPISDYVNHLAEAGLFIYRMHELHPRQTGEWDEPEASLRTRFPSILLVAARKLSPQAGM